jgi:hypothetical protein
VTCADGRLIELNEEKAVERDHAADTLQNLVDRIRGIVSDDDPMLGPLGQFNKKFYGRQITPDNVYSWYLRR